jgi:hypothetical protein
MNLPRCGKPGRESEIKTSVSTNTIEKLEKIDLEALAEKVDTRQNNVWMIPTLFMVGCVAVAGFNLLVSAKVEAQPRFSRDVFDPSCTDRGDESVERNFDLDLTFGNFAFSRAKLIDATRDTTVGQGGRILHGWILYHCFMRQLLVYAMETTNVRVKY